MPFWHTRYHRKKHSGNWAGRTRWEENLRYIVFEVLPFGALWWQHESIHQQSRNQMQTWDGGKACKSFPITWLLWRVHWKVWFFPILLQRRSLHGPTYYNWMQCSNENCREWWRAAFVRDFAWIEILHKCLWFNIWVEQFIGKDRWQFNKRTGEQLWIHLHYFLPDAYLCNIQ